MGKMMDKTELQRRAGILIDELGSGDLNESLLRGRLRNVEFILSEDEDENNSTQDNDDTGNDDNGNDESRDHYGYETNQDGDEMDRDSGMDADNCKSELSSIHDELLSCHSDARRCLMQCAKDGQDIPDTLRTAIDKLGRTLESLEQLVGNL
jgi:hypothetical protein